MKFAVMLLRHIRSWDMQSQSVAETSCPRLFPSRMAVANRRHGLCMLLASVSFTLPLAAQQRTLLDFGHLDLDWSYSVGEWSVKLVWDEVFPVLELEPGAGVLVAKDKPYAQGEGSRIPRPAGTQWDFIGVDAGVDIWVLPSFAFDDPLLEPGFATYGVPSGPGGVRINLVGVTFHGEGVGHLSTYTTSNQVHMTTSNGIDVNDFYLLGRGDHRHVNWAFTAKGVYEVSLTASMLLVANDEESRVTSDPQTFIFAVGVPHMERWLLERGVAPAELGEADTPAGDGVANLLKYALGIPPLEPIGGSRVEPVFHEDGGATYLALDTALNPQAEDIDVWVETSAELVDWNSGVGQTVTLQQTAGRIHVRDALAVGGAGRRFIRLAVERNLPGDDD